MTKNGLIGTSFVAAIPGGFLAYFCIMAFLNFATDMATMLQIVNGTALLFSVLMALSPIAILLFMKKPGAEVEDHSQADMSAADMSASDMSAADMSAAEVAVVPSDDSLGGSSAEVAVAESDDDIGFEATQDFAIDDEVGADSLADSSDDLGGDSFEFDDDEFEFDDEDLK